MPPKRMTLGDRTAKETGAQVEPALWQAEATRQEVIDIPVDQIMPNSRQPRTLFDQAKLEELATSIREHGVIQPIIVRPIPLAKWEGHARRYELIAGERRWRACQVADRATIPALVRGDATDHASIIELALIENLQRADLHPLEEALAFGTMRDQLGYSIRRIAERVGRSKGYVENRINLLDLDQELQQLVSERPDVLKHVSYLTRLAPGDERTQLIAVVREGLSVLDTQERVQAVLHPPAPEAATLSSREDRSGALQGDGLRKPVQPNLLKATQRLSETLTLRNYDTTALRDDERYALAELRARIDALL